MKLKCFNFGVGGVRGACLSLQRIEESEAVEIENERF